MTDLQTAIDAIRADQRRLTLDDALTRAQDFLAGEPELNTEAQILLGTILLQFPDHRDQGAELIAAGLDVEPDTVDWASDLGLAMLLTGRPDRALEVLERAVKMDGADSVTWSRLGATRLTMQNLDGAGEAYQEAVFREPNRAEWVSNLGGIRMRQEKLEEALDLYDQALRLKPDLGPANDMRHHVLHALNRPGEIVEDLKAKLEEDPDDDFLRVRLARVLDMDSRPGEAMAELRTVYRKLKQEELDAKKSDEDDEAEEQNIDPSSAEQELDAAAGEDTDSKLKSGDILMEAAGMNFRRSRFMPALALLNELRQDDPERFDMLVMRTRCLIEMGMTEKAWENFETLRELHPEKHGTLSLEADIYVEEGKYEEAEVLLRQLAEEYPGSADILVSLGHTLMWVGKLDEAAEAFDKASEINPNTLANLVEARDLPEDEKTVQKMRELADNKMNLVQPRMAMSYGLAKIFDKRKDYDLASQYMLQANDLSARDVDYDPDNTEKLFDRYIEVFTPELFERLKGVGSPTRRPIFVCGMPRSGTTLAEQILGSHEKIFPAGELGAMSQVARRLTNMWKVRGNFLAHMNRFDAYTASMVADAYLQLIAMENRDLPFVVDKMPHNFMNLGLIALSMPNARIIHLRRDPRDVGLSNFQQNFKAKHGMLGYSVNLENTGRHLNDHHRLMTHWHKVLPVPIFELDYEALVEDQETVTRELLDFIGVDWDENVTDFHKTERAVRTASVWQVRQPIYKTSRQKWRNYETMLKPMLDVLKPETTAYFDQDAKLQSAGE